MFDKIRSWAYNRNLISGSDAKSQFVKLLEEVGELAHGINKNNEDEIVDAIGDVVVVLTVIAEQYGFAIEHCIESAYEEIKNRKGRMINGVFVKEEGI